MCHDGAAYASIQHAPWLRPDIIKLDRGLITDIHLDPARYSLVTAMVTCAASLGMTVVSEGVETADELAALTGASVRHAQGFHLAQPAATASWRGQAAAPAA